MSTQEYSIIDVIYPVGSIYMSVNTSDPSTLFPNTTWEKIENKFLLGSGSSYTSGATGGSKDAVVVSHSHTFGTNKAVPIINSSDNWGYSGKRKMQYTTGDFYYPYSEKNTDGIGELTNTTSTGSSGTGKNMPPYLVVNIWKRTA